ncbi:MAG: hypothetical protein CME71_01780 [Halobacteriovorax sp.]|mgnify:CR=1 FL=1|nr:hypothetical protein [Halobacteriovorax sp.]
MKKLISIILFYSLTSNANVFVVDQGDIEFKAKGKPALISINGKSDHLTGKLTETDNGFSGEFDLDLNHLSTGIELRDEHLKKTYLKVDQYPQAKLQFSNLKVLKNQEIDFVASLTLHGQTKEINGNAIVSDKNTINAEFIINLADFSIDIPSFKGITVAKDVKIEVNASLKEMIK